MYTTVFKDELQHNGMKGSLALTLDDNGSNFERTKMIFDLTLGSKKYSFAAITEIRNERQLFQIDPGTATKIAECAVSCFGDAFAAIAHCLRRGSSLAEIKSCIIGALRGTGLGASAFICFFECIGNA